MTKYILVEWPESQDFIGNPNCYLVTSLDNQPYYDSAYFVPEELYNKTILGLENTEFDYGHNVDYTQDK